MGPPRSSKRCVSSSLKAWFLYLRPAARPQIGRSTGRATSTSWVISAKRITSCHTHVSAPLHFLQAHRRKTQGQTDMSRPHHSFLIVISLWVNTHYHPHFSFSVKVVFKQMCKFGVSVRHHLEDEKRKDKKKSGATLQQIWRYQPYWFHTSGFHAGLQYRCAVSSGIGWYYLNMWQKWINLLKVWWWEMFMWFKDRKWQWLNIPASRRRQPSALVLLLRSLPARSTRHSWLTFTWFLSWNF